MVGVRCFVRVGCVVAATIGLCAGAGCGRKGGETAKGRGAGSDDPLVSADDQGLMDRAQARARATWEEFAVALSEAEPGRGGYAIKKKFDCPSGDIEYMWLRVVSFDGEVFHAVVDNEAVRTKEVAYGDKVEIRPEDLADWMYLEGNLLRGGFTMRVLYWQESGGGVRAALDAKGIVVGPVDF